jgi:hypothetical protein
MSRCNCKCDLTWEDEIIESLKIGLIFGLAMQIVPVLFRYFS